MKVERLQHVGITVTDVPAAVRFYTEVLGFTVDTNRPDFAFPGAWLDTGNGQVHLIETPEAPPGPARHLSLQVDDLEAWIAHLEQHGVQYRRLTFFPAAGHQIFIQDPSGNTVELNQPIPVGVPS